MCAVSLRPQFGPGVNDDNRFLRPLSKLFQLTENEGKTPALSKGCALTPKWPISHNITNSCENEFGANSNAAKRHGASLV
jgi:hypothetical protein